MHDPPGKICSRCGQFKPLDQYTPHRSGLFGRHAYCKPCRTIANGISRRAHPETDIAGRLRRRPQRLAGKLRYRQARRAELAAKQREYNRTHKEQRRAYVMKRREEYTYASSVRRLERMEQVAGRPRPDLCEVCGKPSRQITFDHDHKTKMFRGWLCHACNCVLGYANDDPEILEKLAEYLRNSRTKPKPQ